jgi:hypothetical protein
MTTSSSQLDNLAESQQSLVQTMTNASRQIQKKIMEHLNDTDSSQLLADYVSQQKELTDKIVSEGYSQEAIQKLPEYAQQYFSMLSSFNTKWVASMQSFSPEAFTEAYREQLATMSQQIEQVLSKFNELFTAGLSGSFNPYATYEQYASLYPFFQRSVTVGLELSRSFFYPYKVLGQLQAKSPFAGQVLIPEQVKQAMDSFNSQSEKALEGMYAQVSQANDRFQEMVNQVSEPFQQFSDNNWKQFEANLQSFSAQAEQAASPLVNEVPGQHQQGIRDYIALQKDLTSFSLQAASLQRTFYRSLAEQVTANHAKFVSSALQQKPADTGKLSEEYISGVEKAVDKVFRSAAFKQGHKQLSTLGAQISSRLQQQAEEAAKSFSAPTAK